LAIFASYLSVAQSEAVKLRLNLCHADLCGSGSDPVAACGTRFWCPLSRHPLWLAALPLFQTASTIIIGSSRKKFPVFLLPHATLCLFKHPLPLLSALCGKSFLV